VTNYLPKGWKMVLTKQQISIRLPSVLWHSWWAIQSVKKLGD